MRATLTACSGSFSALSRELGLVEPQQHLAAQRRQRGRQLVVDRAHHLLGRDAVGHQRGDQRPGAGPDVDVELVDRPVRRQQIERPQGPDLVDAAGESAPAQHERGARRTALATRRSVHLDHVAHRASVWRRDFRPAAGFPTLDMLLRRLTLLIALLALVAAPSAHAAGLAATKKVLQREMARAGGSSGAYVVDLGSGSELYATKADVGRMPASVNKLYTTAAALLRYGADGRLTTRPRPSLPRRDRDDRRQRRPARRRRPDVQHRLGHRAGQAARRRRPAAHRGPRDRRRVGVRRVPRRARLRLSPHQRGRPAERAVLQPRPHRQGRARTTRPARPSSPPRPSRRRSSTRA